MNLARTILPILILTLPSVAAAAPKQRPNVVIVYADDLGWGDVGYHRIDDILTPNIDRLAAEGVQFRQGYVCASVCGPSRCGLMTGVYQQRLGCGENPNTDGFPQQPKFPYAGLPTTQPILSEMLQPLGYRCGAIGKWHLGLHESMRPSARGFDEFYGFLNGAHSYEKAADKFVANKSLWPLFRNKRREPAYEGYLTDTFSDEAVAFIDRNKKHPFFLYVAYNAVHSPWQVPQKYRERTKHLSDVEDRRFFAAMVLAMDDGIGRILSALDAGSIADNTLVFFLSDNGSPRGQGLNHPKKDHQKERGGCTMSNPGPFRGFKGDTFEGGIRVPFVVRWPGRIRPGTKYEHPVTNLDIVPTVMAQVGVTQPPKGFRFDGVDLMPFLTGAKGDQRPHDVLYWRRDDDYAVRRGDWKLAYNDHSCPPGSDAMLFDLANDPGEHHDLSTKHPKTKRDLQALFDAWDSPLPPSRWWGPPKNRTSNINTRQTHTERGQVLAAGAATLHGTGLRCKGGAISHWRDPAAWIEWSLTPSVSARHEITLEYAGPEPANVRVELAGKPLTAKLPGRLDWGDYGRQTIGRVPLEKGRSYALRIRPGNPWHAINVRQIVVEPYREEPQE